MTIDQQNSSKFQTETLPNGFSEATGIRFQIAITTHSEKFIYMKDVSLLRLVRKNQDDDKWNTIIKKLSISEFKEDMRVAADKPQVMSDDAFKAGLHIFNNEISESFFSDKVILVEGVSDKAALEGFAKSKNIDLELNGISIVEVGGKTKIDKPFMALKRLGVPVYVVFDNDNTKGDTNDPIARNLCLQRIAGTTDLVDWPNGVFDTFAAFDPDIEHYIKSQIGEARYEEYMQAIKAMFELTAKDIVKTPAAVSALINQARNDGYEFTNLDSILDLVINL